MMKIKENINNPEDIAIEDAKFQWEVGHPVDLTDSSVYRGVKDDAQREYNWTDEQVKIYMDTLFNLIINGEIHNYLDNEDDSLEETQRRKNINTEKLKESLDKDTKERLEKAYEGNYITIEGADGDPKKWLNTLNKQFSKNKNGQILAYLSFKGKDMNEWARLTGDNAYQDELTFFAFKHNGLDFDELMSLKDKYNAVWFRIMVDNNYYKQGFHPMKAEDSKYNAPYFAELNKLKEVSKETQRRNTINTEEPTKLKKSVDNEFKYKSLTELLPHLEKEILTLKKVKRAVVSSFNNIAGPIYLAPNGTIIDIEKYFAGEVSAEWVSHTEFLDDIFIFTFPEDKIISFPAVSGVDLLVYIEDDAGFIRLNNGSAASDSRLYLVLINSIRPTENQYNKIIEFIEINNRKEILIYLQANQKTVKTIRYNSTNNESVDDLIKRIKRWYTTGNLVEKINKTPEESTKLNEVKEETQRRKNMNTEKLKEVKEDLYGDIFPPRPPHVPGYIGKWLSASSIRPGMYIRSQIYDGSIKMIKITSSHKTDDDDYKVKYEDGGFDYYGTIDKYGIYTKEPTKDGSEESTKLKEVKEETLRKLRKKLKEDRKKDLDLPTEVSIDIKSLVDEEVLADTEFYDELFLDDILSDWLSDEYGFLHFGFMYDVVGDMVYVSNIDWDTSDEDLKESKILTESTGNFGTNDIINLCSPLQQYSDFDDEIKEWKEDPDITESEIEEKIYELMDMYHDEEADKLKVILKDHKVTDFIKIEPGYYDGFYIEFAFDDADELVRMLYKYQEYEDDYLEDFEKVVGNIVSALTQAVEEACLVEYSIAYRFSNGETGYHLDIPYEKTIEHIKAAFNKIREEGIQIIKNDPDLIHEAIVKEEPTKVMAEEWINWVEVLDLHGLTPEQNSLLKRKVKQWYVEAYPADIDGHNWLDAYVTFEEVLDELVSHHGNSIYKLIGEDVDTVVRERIFEELAKILNVDYSDIYDMWLNS